MRVKSIYQPYAELLVRGYKRVETSPYPAPSTVLGQRLGVASTKIIKPEQRALVADPIFQKYYGELNLPALDDLNHGFLLGTVLVHSSDPITEEDLEDVTEEEQIFGDWRVGRYAWRCRDPEIFDQPIAVRGAQGIWIYTAPDYLRAVK